MLVHLVRHGRSEMDPAAAASSWGLHVEAKAGLDALASSGVLPDDAVWFTSREPKAVRTAMRLGAQSAVIEGLHEAERPPQWMDADEFVTAVSTSLERPEVPAEPGWETAANVRARLLDVLHGQVTARAAERGVSEVVLVGHGTAWTVLVAALTDSAADVTAWRTMTMPDHCLLELPNGDQQPAVGRVVRPWGSWRWEDPGRPA